MTWYDWLGAIGSVASIAGLVLTIYVLKTVRRIRTRYVRQAMLESCLRDLRECQQILNESVESRNPNRFRDGLGTLKGILRRIDLHKPDHLVVQWSEGELVDLIGLDNRRVMSQSRPIVARLHDWIVTIELEVTATKWGNDED